MARNEQEKKPNLTVLTGINYILASDNMFTINIMVIIIGYDGVTPPR